jgi:hypothetical protein
MVWRVELPALLEQVMVIVLQSASRLSPPQTEIWQKKKNKYCTCWSGNCICPWADFPSPAP